LGQKNQRVPVAVVEPKAIMRAFILAAGEGTRLGVKTATVPKPMIKIGGKPILEHNIILLAKFGIRDITINTFYQPQRIIEYFGSGASLGVNIQYSHEQQLLGTAGALLPVAEKLSSTFIVLFGDNLSSCDLQKMVDLHKARNAEATVAMFFRSDVCSSGVAEIDSDDRIRRFVEKPVGNEISSNWVNAGIVVSEPSLLDYIPLDRASDLGRDVFPAMLADQKSIVGYRMTEPLYWIDTPEDYERTRAEFAKADSSRCR
jgi:NDP-sugar pyrophosphorylase family protein